MGYFYCARGCDSLSLPTHEAKVNTKFGIQTICRIKRPIIFEKQFLPSSPPFFFPSFIRSPKSKGDREREREREPRRKKKTNSIWTLCRLLCSGDLTLAIIRAAERGVFTSSIRLQPEDLVWNLCVWAMLNVPAMINGCLRKQWWVFYNFPTGRENGKAENENRHAIKQCA